MGTPFVGLLVLPLLQTSELDERLPGQKSQQEVTGWPICYGRVATVVNHCLETMELALKTLYRKRLITSCN